MKNFDFDDLYVYTSPVFWISVILILLFKIIGKIYQWTTIDDYITFFFRLKNFTDDALYRVIKMRKSRPDRIKFMWWHKTLVWNVGARKAIALLRERNRNK